MAGHEQFEEFAAGHALHALEPADEQLFLAHLDECVVCQRSLGDFSELAAGLALSSLDESGDQPPPQLWESIRLEAGIHDDVVVPLDQHRARRRRAWLSAVAAAAVVAVGGVIGWQVAGSGSSTNSVQSAVSDCRQTSDCRVLQLTNEVDRGESAYLLITGNDVRVATASLPAIDPGRQTYVLWQLPRAGRPAGLVAFTVTGAHKSTIAHATLTQPYDASTTFAISREVGTTIPAKPSVIVALGAANSA